MVPEERSVIAPSPAGIRRTPRFGGLAVRTIALATALAGLAAAASLTACEGVGSGLTGVIRTSATLSGITLSSGTLQPVFSADVTAYTAAVNNATDQITVTPTASTAGATILVQGAPVPSGTASQPINLFVGSNQIDIVVTNPDGISTQTYTLTIQRSSF